jgi:hypothetical protein
MNLSPSIHYLRTTTGASDTAILDYLHLLELHDLPVRPKCQLPAGAVAMQPVAGKSAHDCNRRAWVLSSCQLLGTLSGIG